MVTIIKACQNRDHSNTKLSNKQVNMFVKKLCQKAQIN